MKSEIITTYSGIQIEYIERDNRWRFELRGRERTSESLQKAKEIIDKPEPKEKQDFKRFKAWLHSYGTWTEVEVTSIAEKGQWDSHVYYWVSGKDGRTKQSDGAIYKDSPENLLLIEKHQEMTTTIEKLNEDRATLIKSLATLKSTP